MEAVHIGIGCDDHLGVTEVFQIPVLKAKGNHYVVKLLVLVNRLSCLSEDVEGLAAQGEDGLGLHVPGLVDRTGG